MWDLSGNFFLSEDDIGKNRAAACVEKLQELNNAVLVSALTEGLTTEHLSKFQAVVFTNLSLDKAVEFNDYCRSHQPPIPFIKTEVCGLFGSVFCDFGPEFTVLDVDGEDPHTGIIASISNDNPAMVSCVDDERLEFQDGDLVVFSEVSGMTELNDGKPRKIVDARPFSFCIEEDTRNFGIYAKGGIVTQDARKFVEFTASINEAAIDYKMDELDEKLLQHFASGSRAVLNPMAAMFGGIVGQELVKACSGKFHPQYQFFYFDSLESLPTYALDPKDLKPLNSRYDAQISVFGSKLQKKMRDSNIFVVGSGALGCEFLKNFALMGVSCGRKGKLTITDDDVIEKSNLSRQFLFRDWNIGQAKSTVAATAASAINSCLHI
uniref:E1 ubiquitin-activating enzyme n=1 Tax=Aegilops tauschii subsp. strangulata TaxID=200361 RepID=A0A453IAH3_AEGTS